MTIERSDWGASEGPDVNQPQPASATHADAAFTEDETAGHRKLIADGIVSAEEVQRIYGLTDEETAALSEPVPKAPNLADIDAELASIATKRREDRAGYFRDEKMQARERELLEAKLAAVAKRKAEAAATPSPAGSGTIPESVITEWSESPAGLDYSLAQARKTVGALYEDLEEGDRTSLVQGFDGLPEGAQTQAYRFLAVPGGGNFGRADDDAVAAFRATPEGVELAREWGSRAPKNIATVRGRLGLIFRGMSPADRHVATEWFEGLNPQQVKAVYRALVR